MKNQFSIALIGTAFALSSAQAAILNVTPSTNKIDDVTLGSKAVATTEGKSTNLDFIAGGKRIKKILVVKANVYVAQLFVDQKDKFSKTPKEADLETDLTSLNSVSNLGVVALKLDFLRDLSADKIVDSFEDALKSNKLDVATNEGLKKVLAAVKKGGAVAQGDSIAIVGVNGAAQDKLFVENSKGVAEVVEGDSKLVENMFSIWLGIPADSGLERLKGELTQ